MKRMEELEILLNKIEYDVLWNGFSKRKYAIYNEEKFYINDNKGIEMDLVKENSYFVGKRDQRFIGNSVALIDNEYIAIFNIDSILRDTNNQELASLITHEMFHCFQIDNGEKRFPNDLLGIDYPITVENIKIRTLEREYLLKANIEKNKDKKIELLTNYYSLRNKREKLIGSMLDYEKAIESVEGTAVYVEYKSRTQLSLRNKCLILDDYIKEFTNINKGNLKIRASSYIQGLLLCEIADEFIENWKGKFLNSKLFLSDFIKNELKIEAVDIKYNYKNIDNIENYINNWKREKDLIFKDFDEENKSNIMKEGFQVTGFDPMNMIKREKEVIHKNFLKIKIGENEEIIKGPIKATIGDNIFDVRSITW